MIFIRSYSFLLLRYIDAVFVLPDVFFTVGLSVHTTFRRLEIIKFDRVINNVGGGYIDDVNNADYGKFIAPVNGTYQFNANLFSNGKAIGADFIRNGAGGVIAMNNGGAGNAGFSVILDLTAGDEVWLQITTWADASASYNRYYNSFSGVLIYES